MRPQDSAALVLFYSTNAVRNLLTFVVHHTAARSAGANMPTGATMGQMTTSNTVLRIYFDVPLTDATTTSCHSEEHTPGWDPGWARGA